MRKTQLLFLIIFIEGYVVLATELLAIRGLIPFVGSGVEVVSIIIGAVLLPLAIGYYTGGKRAKKALKHARAKGRHSIFVRRILQRNLLLALFILALGLSYPLQLDFFGQLQAHGAGHRIAKTALFSAVFLVYPTYLLAQTVPLVSNYFSRARLSEITGRMLFFSTAGSFFGSIVSTLVLMTFIGVHNTTVLTLALIAVLIVLVSPRSLRINSAACLIVLVSWLMNSTNAMKALDIVANTPYSLIAITETRNGGKLMKINHSYSSFFTENPWERAPYVHYIDKQFIYSLPDKPKRSILVLGAGGFVVGWNDLESNYTFVDIDEALKAVSEEHFLPHPLSPNKRFVGTSARAFLRSTQEKYDLVIVDLFSNINSIPAEAITQEFLQDAKKALKPDGVLVSNVISDPKFSDLFTVRYYNTFASVFPVFDRHVVGDFDAWKGTYPANTLYIYYNKSDLNSDRSVYTDDKNSYSLDH